MKTYQLDNKPKNLYFTNYDRIDEEVLFQNILVKLKSSPEIEIGKKQTGPAEDLYGCKLSGSSFWLVYDIDYGTSIRVNDIETIRKLKEIFETE